MNSQQELIDVIKDIAKKQNHTYDTPATVLRVEGDTVWVHIDGGADETPVRKTINCEQGEIVQVRISNGSAFLVGNASAPPTDDKTAKVAHFVAEEAEFKAVRAQDTAAEAQERATIAQTAAAAAQAAVAQSLITYETWYKLSADTPTQPTEDSHTGWSTAEPAWSSSSTDKLYFSVRTVKGDGTATWSAVGMVQSYADLQILKNAIISTVASEYVAQGDSNVTDISSTMYQDAYGVNIFNDTLAVGDSYAHIDGDSFDIKQATTAGQIDNTNDKLVATFGTTSQIRQVLETIYQGRTYQYGSIFSFNEKKMNLYKFDQLSYLSQNATLEGDNLSFSLGSTGMNTRFGFSEIFDGLRHIDPWDEDAMLYYNYGDLYVHDRVRTPKVTDFNGNALTPTILESTTISASTTSYTFTDDAITEDSVIDVHDTISRFVYTDITAGNGSCTITFPAQSSTHKIKLFVY